MSETLASAYVAAFAEIEGAAKDAKNPHFKSKYADLPSVIAAVKPALSKHGLAFFQKCEPSDEGVIVETVLVHSSGEQLSLGRLYVPANKKDAQGFGSAQTYARRYSLQTAFGVPAEDDDGNAASASNNRGERSPALISDAQRVELMTMVEASGADLKGFCTFFQIGALPELPADKFDRARAMLAKKLAEKSEQREMENA